MLSASLFSTCQRTEGHNSLYEWMKINTSLYYNNEIELDDDSLVWLKEMAKEVRWQIELARLALNYPETRAHAKWVLSTHGRLLAELEELALKYHVLLDESLDTEQQEQLREWLKGSSQKIYSQILQNQEQVTQLLQNGQSLRKKAIHDFAIKHYENLNAR